jgi:hypothetical protein
MSISKKLVSIFTLLILLISSCKTVKIDSNRFEKGNYKMNYGDLKEKVYVDLKDDLIRINTLENRKSSSDAFRQLLFPEYQNVSDSIKLNLRKQTMDIDFLTIPFKFRFASADIPNQINATLNAAVYLGYRLDFYSFQYKNENIENIFNRKIRHTAFSFGGVSSLGNAFISPTTTKDVVQDEYDGVVLSYGFAGILAVDDFTLGLVLGYDYLLDDNKSSWIYQNKPWIGLSFGLNLN